MKSKIYWILTHKNNVDLFIRIVIGFVIGLSLTLLFPDVFTLTIQFLFYVCYNLVYTFFIRDKMYNMLLQLYNDLQIIDNHEKYR